MAETNAILQARGLTVGYAGRSVVRDISFAAVPGRILTLIGPNGAGKSTILKTLVRSLPPLSGELYLDGRDMGAIPERDIARSVAVVLTGQPRAELMTCRDVVASGRYPYTGALGILSAKDREIVREAMERVRVLELSDRPFDRISDGQRQRVLLARAVCQQPRLLIMDEPTSFLDVKHKLDFLGLLTAMTREKGVAVILSLHELELARRFADTLLCVRNGKVDRSGPPAEIFAENGAYLDALYGMEPGSYESLYGG